MPSCSVSTCDNRSRTTKGTGIRYFRFPKNEEFTKQWIAACRRKVNLKHAVVCSIHFEPKYLEPSIRHKLLNYKPKNTRGVRPDAVPTLKLNNKNVPAWKQDADEERSLRIERRRRRLEVDEILKAAAESATEEELVDADASCLQSQCACEDAPQPPTPKLSNVNKGQEMQIKIERRKSCCVQDSPPEIAYSCANATVTCDEVEQGEQLDQLIEYNEQYDGDILKLNNKIEDLQQEMATLLKKVEEITDEKCKVIKKYEHILAKRFTLRWSGE